MWRWVETVLGRRPQDVNPREAAARALRDMPRASRQHRGRSARGEGPHFGKTKIKKYGDEHRDADDRGGSWDSGGGGGSSSSD